MFDLASVVAIAAAASQLQRGLASAHIVEVLPSFLAAFFMIWWSWMNYTWFASAYDDGSRAFRLLTMVAMSGALLIAAGIPAVFQGVPIHVSLAGFVLMRVAMATLWFGAAVGDPACRNTAVTYGVGILLLQAYWVWLVLAVSPAAPFYNVLFPLGIILEVSVPVLAEHRHGETSWHRHHIVERYGLMTIIVLGECFVAIAGMLVRGESLDLPAAHTLKTALACIVITFSIWGLYFTDRHPLEDRRLRRALLWGYGHFAVFASVAAIGAGFKTYHEIEEGHAGIGLRTAELSIAIPIAIFLLAIWFIRDRFQVRGLPRWLLPAAALLIAALPLIADADLFPIAATLCITVVLHRHAIRAHSPQATR